MDLVRYLWDLYADNSVVESEEKHSQAKSNRDKGELDAAHILCLLAFITFNKVSDRNIIGFHECAVPIVV